MAITICDTSCRKLSEDSMSGRNSEKSGYRNDILGFHDENMAV
jgi:hypothetical protein